ncbi:MAG: WYL domain-containing transcriptional regulator [Thermoguttaceae bacterium]|nr:WYL domain-containing transcriptional regulator [Thermoguttaceae bacterium]
MNEGKSRITTVGVDEARKKKKKNKEKANDDSKSTFIRQWQVLQALASASEGASLQELAERFKTSPKTIRRDLTRLGEVFNGLKSFVDANDHGRKRYYFSGNEFSFGLGLNYDELLALYVGQTLAAPLCGAIFGDEAQNALGKIKRALPKERVEYAERVAPLVVRMESARPIYPEVASSVVGAALTALGESRKLRVRYRSLKSKTLKTYVVRPYNFVYFRGSLYLIGYSCKDQEVRFWKFSRMLDADALVEKFERPKDFDADAYLASSFTPYVGETETTRVKMRFFGSSARIVCEERLNGCVATTPESGGTTIVELETEYGKAFARWALGYGAGAETLEPPEARAAVWAELEEVARRYGATLRPLDDAERTKEKE